MKHDIADDAQPVVACLADFDPRSGSALERAFFNHRPLVLLLCLVATLLLAWQALGLKLNASFEKTIPTQHPYIANYLANQGNLGGQGNALRIAVAVKQGDIFTKDYLETLQKLNDEVFLLPGVDRPFMKSLWTSNTRWIAVTEEGLDGNTVMGDGYDGSPAALAEVRANVERSGEIGQIVAADFQSSIIFVPLLDKDPRTGTALDYGELSRRIEGLRAKYQSDGIRIHVTGFAKVAGDLIDGLRQMLGFFALALAITTGVLYGYTRCIRSTLLVVACSLIAVAWQFGLLKLLGYELDPYSVLVPFLVFVNTLPKVAIAPLFLIWMGYGIFPNMLMGALIGFFPVVINTAVGLSQVEADMLDLGRVFNAPKWKIFVKIRIPNALPYILSALKITATAAVVGAIVGEFVASQKGLGYIITTTQSSMNTSVAFASLIWISVIGLLLYGAVVLVARLWAPWAEGID